MFSVMVEDESEGCERKPSAGPIYRNILAKYEFPHPDPSVYTAWDIFSLVLIFGKHTRRFTRKWYISVLHYGLLVPNQDLELEFMDQNFPQWIVAMEACNAHSLICVPLYDTLGPGAVNYILNHAEVDFVFVQDKNVKELLNPECIHAKRLKLIVCFSLMTEETKEKAVSTGIKPYSWNDFLLLLTADDVYISFLPLAHILDRMIEEFFFSAMALLLATIMGI